jgi:hypothetical protein
MRRAAFVPIVRACLEGARAKGTGKTLLFGDAAVDVLSLCRVEILRWVDSRHIPNKLEDVTSNRLERGHRSHLPRLAGTAISALDKYRLCVPLPQPGSPV